MEKYTEFTNDKKVKNELLSIILSSDKKEILEIAYNQACCYKTSNITPGILIHKYSSNMDRDTIMLAFKKLCQFEPQKCYDLYQILNNNEYKNILLNVVNNYTTILHKYNTNYKNIKYKQNLFVGNIKRDYYHFYVKLNTWKSSLFLNEERIVKGTFQKIDIPPLSNNCKEYIDDNLTNDIITYLSSLICEGDLEEYQNLLNSLDKNSKDYKAVLNGGKLYTNKIKSLQRSLIRK